MKCYVAAPFSWKDEIKKYTLELEALGIESTASWVYEEAEPNSTLDQFPEEQHREIAAIDVRDINRADIVVVFTIDPLGPPLPRGGRHWETGYAYGRGKEVVVVGPYENIFHYLGDVKRFDTKKAATDYLYQRSLN